GVDIRLSFERPVPTLTSKMASEGLCKPEISDESTGEEKPGDSPQSAVYHYSESDDDSSPSKKGDIKRLLTDLRQVWKSDLPQIRTEIGEVNRSAGSRREGAL
ncbi:Hypothetical predicted protein, partial [Pelobates cultripes]